MKRTALFACLLTTAACSTGPEPAPPAPVQTPARAARPGGPDGPGAVGAQGAPGPMMGGGDAPASAGDVPEQPQDEKVDALQKAYDADKSAPARDALTKGLVANANYYMYKAQVPPRVKYTTALALYRRALKLDPNNTVAKDAIAQIEAIYKQMGRPVPAEPTA